MRTFEEKLQIIAYAKASGVNAAADEYDMSSKAVRNILSKEENLLKKLNEAKENDIVRDLRRLGVLCHAEENKLMKSKIICEEGKHGKPRKQIYCDLDKHFEDFLSKAREDEFYQVT